MATPDVQCGALVTKIIERRGVMLGLHVPQTAVLKIVEEATPKETSTERIEAALNALLTDGRKKTTTRPRNDRRRKGPLRPWRSRLPSLFSI